jgi:multidrug efflux pump subunit AcrB
LRPILGQVVSMVLGLILIASWGWSLAMTDGLLGPAVLTLIVTPTPYVVWFHGKERDTGNVIMV